MSLIINIGQPLHFASKQSELVAINGSHTSLQCVLDVNLSQDGESFTWTGPAMDSGRALIISVYGLQTVSTLHIDPVDQSDEGRYSCSCADVGTVFITLDVEIGCKFACTVI